MPRGSEPAMRCAESALRRPDAERSARPDAGAQGPHDRGLLARGGADLLADSGVEDRLRPGGPAVVVHGHAHLVRLAHAHGPRRRAAGLRGPAADDEDGAADDLPARGGRRAGPERILRLFSRLDRGRLPCELVPTQAGRRDRALARARWSPSRPRRTRCRRWASSSGSGGASCKPEYPGPAGRGDSRPAAWRHGGDRRGPHAAGGLPGRQLARKGSTPARRCTRPKC